MRHSGLTTPTSETQTRPATNGSRARDARRTSRNPYSTR